MIQWGHGAFAIGSHPFTTLTCRLWLLLNYDYNSFERETKQEKTYRLTRVLFIRDKEERHFLWSSQKMGGKPVHYKFIKRTVSTGKRSASLFWHLVTEKIVVQKLDIKIYMTIVFIYQINLQYLCTYRVQQRTINWN